MTLNGSEVVRFNAEEFLQLGLRLVNYEPNEAGYRTAINRVYYACYLIGCESTDRKGWFTRQYSGQDHAGLWRALKEHNTPWWDKLRTLYELREDADYHTTTLVDEKTWVIAKNIANDIFPRLQSIMP